MLGSSAVDFEPMPMIEVELIAILDLSDGWRNWLSSAGRKSCRPPSGSFARGPSCRSRSWRPGQASGAGRSTVAAFCCYWGVSVSRFSTLFEAVSKGAQGILNCRGDEAPDICHTWAITLHAESAFSQEVAQLDAAIQTFGIHDHEERENEKVRIVQKLRHRDESLFAYAQTRATVKGKRKRLATTKQLILSSDIKQCDAKKFALQADMSGSPGHNASRPATSNRTAGYQRCGLHVVRLAH